MVAGIMAFNAATFKYLWMNLSPRVPWQQPADAFDSESESDGWMIGWRCVWAVNWLERAAHVGVVNGGMMLLESIKDKGI